MPNLRGPRNANAAGRARAKAMKTAKNVDISVDKLQQFRFKGPNYQQLFQHRINETLEFV